MFCQKKAEKNTPLPDLIWPIIKANPDHGNGDLDKKLDRLLFCQKKAEKNTPVPDLIRPIKVNPDHGSARRKLKKNAHFVDLIRPLKLDRIV